MSKEVTKQILKVALVMAPACLLMVGVFYILNATHVTDVEMMPVWIGAAIGYVASVGNFVLLALTVTYACRQTAAKARAITSFSYTSRLVLLAVIIILSVLAPFVNYIAVVIPLVIPQIALTIIGLFFNKKKTTETEANIDEKAEAPQEWPEDEPLDEDDIPVGTYVDGEPDEFDESDLDDLGGEYVEDSEDTEDAN